MVAWSAPTITAPWWRRRKTGASRSRQELANTSWWEQLNDPVLNDLIGSSLKENKDLLIAAARVEEFAGRYGLSVPTSSPRSAPVRRPAGSSAGAGEPLPPGIYLTINTYQTTLNASWELDIWGRVRRSTEAARAQLLASEEGRRAVILSLVSAVAGSYVNLRDLDRQLEIARDTVKTRKESLDLFKLRFEGGFFSELERPGKVPVRRGPGRHPAVREGHHPAGKRPQRAAGPQPGADPAGENHRSADSAVDPRRAPLGSAGAAARHPPGRTEPDRRQRQIGVARPPTSRPSA